MSARSSEVPTRETVTRPVAGALRRALPVAVLVALAGLGGAWVLELELASVLPPALAGASAESSVIAFAVAAVVGWPLLLGRALGAWPGWGGRSGGALVVVLGALAVAMVALSRASGWSGVQPIALLPVRALGAVLLLMAAAGCCTFLGRGRVAPGRRVGAVWPRRVARLSGLALLLTFALAGVTTLVRALPLLLETSAPGGGGQTPIGTLTALGFVLLLGTTPLRVHVMERLPAAWGRWLRDAAVLMALTVACLALLTTAVSLGLRAFGPVWMVGQVGAQALALALTAATMRREPSAEADEEVSDVFR